jgi:hypothetical protein
VESLAVGVSCLGPWSSFVQVSLAVIMSLRIVEIIQVSINVTVFDASRGRADEGVASRIRMLTLAGINFVELLLCFGTIYACNYQKLAHAGTPVTAYYFSIITQLTVGYGDVYPTGWLRLVAAAQGLFGTLFLVFAVARMVASFPPLREYTD